MIPLKKIFGYLLLYYLFLIPFRGSFLIITFITLSFFFYLMNKDMKLFFLIFVSYLLTFKLLIVYWDFPRLLETLPVIISFMSISALFNRSNLIKFEEGSKSTRVIYYFLALLVVLMLSSVLNLSSIEGMIISFGWTFYGLMIFLVAYYHKSLDRSFLYELGRLLFLIIMLQLPVQFIQVSGIFFDSGPNPDNMFGTFGLAGTSNLAVYLIFITQCTLIYTLRNKLNLISLIIFGVVVISAIIGDMTYVKVALLASPLVIGIALGPSAILKEGGIKFISIIVILFVGLWGLMNLQENKKVFQKQNRVSFDWAALMNPAKFVSYSDMEYSSSEGIKVGRRLGLVLSAANILSGDQKEKRE